MNKLYEGIAKAIRKNTMVNQRELVATVIDRDGLVKTLSDYFAPKDVLFIPDDFAKACKEMKMKKGRTVYFLLESQTNDNGEFRVLIAVENESGYYKTDWFWGKDLKVAEKIAQGKNETMGVSREEAFKIVASTMRKGAVEKPRF